MRGCRKLEFAGPQAACPSRSISCKNITTQNPGEKKKTTTKKAADDLPFENSKISSRGDLMHFPKMEEKEIWRRAGAGGGGGGEGGRDRR